MRRDQSEGFVEMRWNELQREDVLVVELEGRMVPAIENHHICQPHPTAAQNYMKGREGMLRRRVVIVRYEKFKRVC